MGIVVLATAVVAGGVVWVWTQLTRPVRLPAAGVVVRIEPGWAMRKIAGRLERGGVVGNARILTALARWRREDRRLRAGEYRFTGTVTMTDVLRQLQSPMSRAQIVTIPEGRTTAEIIPLLVKAGLGGRDVFECLTQSARWLQELDLPPSGVEGYLFPDTYAFTRGTPPDEVLRRMVNRYRRHAARLSASRVRAGLSEHEMVTLASLIEKETGNAAERPLVSAVFHNRLQRGMPLQSDPTAVYERGDFAGPITRTDLAMPSRYNTYQHPGLPPGPICNPSLASLEAAIHPANVPYLYFVSRNDGRHEFSATLADHNRAVRRYRRY